MYMKRTILSAAGLLLTVALGAQVKYDVTCRGLENGRTVYLNNGETQQALDSAVVAGGEVHFRGEQPETVAAVLGYESGKMRNVVTELLLDETPVVIADGHLQSGSPLNMRYAQYTEKNSEINGKAEAVMNEYQALQMQYGQQIPQEKIDDLRQRLETINKEANDVMLHMLVENRDNLIPLLALRYAAEGLGYDFLAEYLPTYAYANRPSLQPLRQMLEKEACKMPGAEVVDFEMPGLDEKPVRLTDYVGKGNYVLVDFWASWCGPCRQDMPHVKSLYEKYHPKGFEIVGVSLDNNKAAWERAVKDLGIAWPQMSDLKGWQSHGASLYNIRAIPATILFDPQGKVVADNLRGETLTKKLEEIYEQK